MPPFFIDRKTRKWDVLNHWKIFAKQIQRAAGSQEEVVIRSKQKRLLQIPRRCFGFTPRPLRATQLVGRHCARFPGAGVTGKPFERGFRGICFAVQLHH